MSNNYAPCFNKMDFVVIPSNIELPCYFQSNNGVIFSFCLSNEQPMHSY